MIARVLGMLLASLDDLTIDYVSLRHAGDRHRATLAFRTDESAAEVALALGVELCPHSGDGYRWQMADVNLDGVALTIQTPMRRIDQLPRPQLEVVS